MRIDEFDYELPEHLIAKTPILNRDQSRLLAVDKHTGLFSEHRFRSILDFLTPEDVLVLNNTKVIPARLIAQKATGAEIEILLSSPGPSEWEWTVLLKPAKRVREGDVLFIGEGLSCTVIKKDGLLNTVRFEGSGHFFDLIDAYGHVPVPPYISQDIAVSDSFKERYQTVFATQPGAVAAPTAGLHFTHDLLDEIRRKNIAIETVTLHVGYGTFQPISVSDIRDHHMHAERYFIEPDVAERLNQYKQEGKRIIGVGTTAVRTLESASHNGALVGGAGESSLYIYPGYSFHFVEAMVTNFHLPKSSLMLLVSAFGGHKTMMKAYQHAVKESFRFFSFGDAMFIY